MAETADLYKWPTGKITWRQAVSLAQVPADIVESTYRAAWAAWAAVCGISPVEAPFENSVVNLSAVNADGGAEGFTSDDILALTQLPAGVTMDAALWQRINDHEAWTESFLYLVLLHEIGHAIGLVHSTNQADIMYPYYNASLTGLSSGDIAQGVLRYGPSTIVPAPATSTVTPQAPTSTAPAQVFEVNVDVARTLEFNLAIGFPDAGVFEVSVSIAKKT